MAGRQAKILSPDDLHDLLVFASCTRNPLRNRVLVLLSTKAGLRAGEIANLTWSMVTGASGRISNLMELPDYAAKKGGGRQFPYIRTSRLPLPNGGWSPHRQTMSSCRNAAGR
jgi:integrase